MKPIALRNAYMLNHKTEKNAYDWWWHSLVAKNTRTGEFEPFFIEYYIVNPARGGNEPVFGSDNGPVPPAYAMIKAGKWGENKAQIHNFFGTDQFFASTKKMEVKIADNYADEFGLSGSVKVSESEAAGKPEWMSDAGEMTWDLKIRRKDSYSVGYGASPIFRKLKLFEMFWHVQGMSTSFSGEIFYNGLKYEVNTGNSFGYQDKNWGADYTNPWIWLNCNNFTFSDGSRAIDSSLDLGGGNPKILGFAIGPKILVAFKHQKVLYEFNFSKIFFQKQKWECRIDREFVYWDILVSNRKHILKINFKCDIKSMIKVNYRNPKGLKEHNQLWNGGYAFGTLELFDKRKPEFPVLFLNGSMGGCEYGSF